MHYLVCRAVIGTPGRPGQSSTERCPERRAVPGRALWSSVPPARRPGHRPPELGTIIKWARLFRLLDYTEMLEEGEEEEASEADRPENAPSDEVGGLSGRVAKDEKKAGD